MGATWGVWDDEAGGFVHIEHGGGSAGNGLCGVVREEFIAEADPDEREKRAGELTVIEVCEEHIDDEQPAFGCELCDEDDEDDAA